MIEVLLALLGLVFGSFVNALTWRIKEQVKVKDKKTKAKDESSNQSNDLSILHGRSMCPNCKHTLATKDLVPVLSWLQLKGKCRYCHTTISPQYPIVELTGLVLFLISYWWWPVSVHGSQIALFVIWLMISVGLLALFVYDLLWLILPNRIVYPLGCLAAVYGIVNIFVSGNGIFKGVLDLVLAVLIGGGIFYLLFQVSDGKWIGGGDVRLGWVLGLIAGTPGRSVLFIFIASIIGTLVSLPLLASNRLKKNSLIPFGPFLIVGLIITQLFGVSIIHWYTHILI